MDSPEKYQVGTVSVQGRRGENQDRLANFDCPLGKVLVVADGMGGHKGGATAAVIATSRLEELLQESHADVPAADVLRDALQVVNQEIYFAGQREIPELAGMGSTIVVALLTDELESSLLVAYAGDSRCYLQHNGKLQQLTKDHTAVQRMVDAQLISTEDARYHPDASVISRALGQGPMVDIDLCGPFSIQKTDGVLLCSDGLSSFVSDQMIEDVLANGRNPQAATDQLAALALRNESDDNISVVYLQYGAQLKHLAFPGKNSEMFRISRQQVLIAGIFILVLLAVTGLITALNHKEKQSRMRSITIMNGSSPQHGTGPKQTR